MANIIGIITKIVDNKLFPIAPGGRLRLDGPNAGKLPTANMPDPLKLNNIFTKIQHVIGATESSGSACLELHSSASSCASSCASSILEHYNANGMPDFSIDHDGSIRKIRGVPYQWPDSQGAAGMGLVNDGGGNLSWAAVASSGSSVSSSCTINNYYTTNNYFSSGSFWGWQTFFFSAEGNLTTGAKNLRVYMPGAYKIDSVFIAANTASSGSAIIVDVNKGGTTIFTNQANRPQIAVGANTGTSGVPDVTALAAGDYLTFDIDQIGVGTTGADLTVHVRCKQQLIQGVI